MDRDAALSLLRSQHDFPGSFEFRVVVLPEVGPSVLAAMLTAAGEGAEIEDVRERLSRRGTYVALRIRIALADAVQVLDVYEVVQAMEGVKAVM